MAEQISDVITDIKSIKNRIYEYDEAKTKQVTILRILASLGWDTFNVEEVCPEYSVGNRRVDYSLRISNANKVFLEAKKASEELEKENHQEQILSYSFHQGVKLAILTNGLVWWFYLPLIEGAWEQRKFYSIDFSQQETADIAARFSDFLLKSNIVSGKAYENAEFIYKSKQKQKILQDTIPKAWNRIISEPNDLLVDLVNEVSEEICGIKTDNDMIENFLSIHKERFIIHQNIPQISQRKIIETSKPLNQTQGLLHISESFITKKIFAFQFLGSKYEVNTWKDFYVKLCEIISKQHEDEFNKVTQLRGSKYPYFTYSKEGLKAPVKIGNTNIFVEAYLGVTQITQRCRQIIALFGYSDNDLLIEVIPD